MKKNNIFYYIVSAMTFIPTRPKTVKIKGYIVTREEADNYKKKVSY